MSGWGWAHSILSQGSSSRPPLDRSCLSAHPAAANTFGLILPAEIGDKTQPAVAGMAGTLPAIPVWIGATLALGTTSALGILVGRKLLRCIPMHRLHQISGVFFLVLAAFALTKVF